MLQGAEIYSKQLLYKARGRVKRGKNGSRLQSYIRSLSFSSWPVAGVNRWSFTSIYKMADKEKKVKKKKKEDAPAAEAAADAAPAPAPAAETRSSSKGSSKKAKRSGSNVFSMFSQHQVAEFKEAFQLMDNDKDGIIGKADLRATFDAVGKLSNEKELDEMINEAPGPINFTQLLSLFALRMQDSGGSDDDDVVVAAFRSFDENGTIDSERFRHALMTWGDKFSAKEVDNAFDAMEIDDHGRIDTNALISLLTGAEEEGEGEAA